MPFPRPTLTQLRSGAMQDITASDLANADGFLRRSFMRVCAWVQAGLAFLHYGFLDWISLQSTPFTATGEYLEAWAALAPTPVLREAPTPASCPAVTWAGGATTLLPSGTACSRGDGTQYLTVGDATVSGGSIVTAIIQAVVAGSAGNADSGTPITLGVVIPGINPAGVATVAVTGGTDLELDDSLRARMLESYANPPHGGCAADYETWALQVPGVTRAWCAEVPVVPGTVVVYFMMDVAEAAYGGFPQGTDGVATLETRDTPATGDMLAVANYIFPLRPVTPVVYAVAPAASAQNITLAGLTGISTAQQAQVAAALTFLFVQKDSPLAANLIEQSDVSAALTAIGGLPSFAITVPSSWPITSATGYLFTLGTVTYV